MALHQSPNIVTNGLVFAYDMSNTKKSWKGAPVTNSFNCPNPYDANNVSFIINGTGTFQRVYSGTYGGYTITPEDVVYRYNLGDGGCHYHGNSAAISAGQYVCYSVDYYVSPDASDYPTNTQLVSLENYGGSALSGGTGVSSDVTTKGKWQTIQGNAGPTAGSGTQAMFLYPGGCGGAGSYIASRGFILMKNPMFEFRSDVRYTPFVNGTRSNTQAILDLTNNSTITASSLTYASDGTFRFGGSGQRLDTSLTTFGNNATWEACINGTSDVSTYNMFMGRYLPYFGFYGANSLYFSNIIGGAQQTIQTATNLTTNTWYHAVFTTSYNGTNTTMKIYTNGIETASGTFSGAQGLDGAYNFAIGDGYNASWYRFDGRVESAKVYNRTLSATEVQQNFNALRSRYGI